MMSSRLTVVVLFRRPAAAGDQGAVGGGGWGRAVADHGRVDRLLLLYCRRRARRTPFRMGCGAQSRAGAALEQDAAGAHPGMQRVFAVFSLAALGGRRAYSSFASACADSRAASTFGRIYNAARTGRHGQCS